MIDLTIYVSTIAILSAIIMALLIYSLKAHKIEQENSELKKLVVQLQKKDSESQAIILSQQSQIQPKTRQIFSHGIDPSKWPKIH